MKKDIFFETEIEYVNDRGYGIGKTIVNDTKYTAYVLNGLAGEKVKVHAFNKKRGNIYGAVVEWFKKSSDRVKPNCGEHFLACSPFQNLSYTKQLEFKSKSILDNFKNESDTSINDISITPSTSQFNYRNKVEFGFYQDWETDIVTFSYFKRGGSKGRYSIDKCELLHPKMNKIGALAIKIINENKISSKAIKYLLVRYSNHEDNISVDLFIKDKDVFNENFDYSIFNQITNTQWVKGFRVIYSNPLSPASRNDGVLYKYGTDTLTENVIDTQLDFDSNSFFQVNVPTFELLINDLRNVLEGLSKSDTSYNINERVLLDFYCGVGTIGLLIKDYFKGIVGVESSLNSQVQASHNALLNNCLNAKFIETDAKNAKDYITSQDVLLMDPPRSGVDDEILAKINQQKPQLIIYISCNSKTLSNNFNTLKENYKISFIKAYDFYPGTPHVETLCILTKK